MFICRSLSLSLSLSLCVYIYIYIYIYRVLGEGAVVALLLGQIAIIIIAIRNITNSYYHNSY